MIISTREQGRQVFYETWDKFRRGIPMSPLENQVLSVIINHPDYQDMLESRDTSFLGGDEDKGGHNPFLHMGLHIALMEQISTNRPQGITSLYQALLPKYTDEHKLQHRIMHILEETLWNAQQHGKLPDEKKYLEKLRKLSR